MPSRQVVCGVTSDGQTEVPLLVDTSGALATTGGGVGGGGLTDAELRASAVPVAPNVYGAVASPTDSFTRPSDTTAYAIGDLVANSVTAGSVVAETLTVGRAADGAVMLRRCKLHKSGTSVTNAQFRVHFFTAAVTCANGDNGAFSTSGVASYLGAMDVTIDRAFTDGAAGIGVPVVGQDISFRLAGGATTVRALIEARAAYTPVSAEVFTLTLDAIQA